MALIVTENLHKKYFSGLETELHVLRGINLTIEAGQSVAIMGPSGSGKSTLMHLLGFLDTVTEGRYFFDGEDVSHFTEDELASIRNTRVGFVFQQFHLLPRTSAIENVQLPMIYAGVSSAEQVRRATEALEAVGLGDRLDHLPNELSGGQQQRVSIARALVNNPKVLFADEPTGNLDTQSSEEIMEIFMQLNREGKTLIMVTHEPDIAQYCERVIHLRDGVIERDQRRAPRA
ncbi:ABC transporter ATP-binding protein [Candidatus Peribacteria bacterium]|nr:ABC transporter ATP-binding protein [Candidatus Peribacteria bacterium]